MKQTQTASKRMNEPTDQTSQLSSSMKEIFLNAAAKKQKKKTKIINK